MTQKLLIGLLDQDYEIHIKFMSICGMGTRYYQGEYRNTYQVHCEDHRNRHSELYYDIHEAAKKFLELRKELYA